MENISTKDLHLNKTALSDKQLLDWCSHNNFTAHVGDLNNLANNKYSLSFVFTGASKDEFNNGADHHWLAQADNRIMDSYGKEDYKLPENYKYLKHSPKRIQAYDTNVCGEFCALFLKFVNDSNGIKPDEYGEHFCNEYNFGNNTTENSKKILAEYERLKGQGDTKHEDVKPEEIVETKTDIDEGKGIADNTNEEASSETEEAVGKQDSRGSSPETTTEHEAN